MSDPAAPAPPLEVWQARATAAAALGLTAARIRDQLVAFEARALLREMTGQGRLRYGQPAL